MPTFRVDVEGRSKPYVCLEFEQDHEPTEDEIDAELNKFIVNSGYDVTNIERYG